MRLLSDDTVDAVPTGGLVDDIEKHDGGQHRMGNGPQKDHQRGVEQVGGHGIRPRPGPGKSNLRAPAQKKESEKQRIAVALQTKKGIAGRGVIEGDNGESGFGQQDDPQRDQPRDPEPVPRNIPFQDGTQPEVREEDDGAAERPASPELGETARKAPGGDG